MESSESAPVLVARDISKRFGGVQALSGVTLEVREGDVHCLAGENGCGKSTLIKIISGVETPDTGVIEIGGVDHARMTPREAIRSGIQVIYQDFSLFPNLTVAENITLTAMIAQGSRLVSPQGPASAGRRRRRRARRRPRPRCSGRRPHGG